MQSAPVSLDFVSGDIRTLGKTNCFPRDHTLNVYSTCREMATINLSSGCSFHYSIISLALVGDKMIIANSALRASLATCYLISAERALELVEWIKWILAR